MKIAYVFLWRIAKPDGVSKKIRGQVRAWRAAGHEVLALCLTDELELTVDDDFELVKLDTRHGLLARLRSEFAVRAEITERVDAFAPEVVYMRQSARGGTTRKLAGRYPAVIEVNADEIKQLAVLAKESGKLKHWLRYWWVKLNFGRTYGALSGIVGVTSSLAKRTEPYASLGKPAAVVPNGIDLQEFGAPVPPAEVGEGRLPQVVFIGGTYAAPWHGIDLVMELARRTVGKLEFHVVGTSLEGVEAPPNVTGYGYLQRVGCLEVFGRCDVGLGTVALFRNEMDEGCPLKMRDYLAAGLAVVVPYQETALCDPDGQPLEADWALTVPNREGGLVGSADQIIAFCEGWKGRRTDPEVVRPLIDVVALEQRRLAFLKEVAGRQ